MKSTGEVLGVGKDVYEALYKGFLASDMQLEKNTGVVLATVDDHDKEEFLQIAKGLAGLGYSFTATSGTAKLLKDAGLQVREVKKIKEGEPNLLSVIKNREVDLSILQLKGNDSTGMAYYKKNCYERNIEVITPQIL